MVTSFATVFLRACFVWVMIVDDVTSQTTDNVVGPPGLTNTTSNGSAHSEVGPGVRPGVTGSQVMGVCPDVHEKIMRKMLRAQTDIVVNSLGYGNVLKTQHYCKFYKQSVQKDLQGALSECKEGWQGRRQLLGTVHMVNTNLQGWKCSVGGCFAETTYCKNLLARHMTSREKEWLAKPDSLNRKFRQCFVLTRAQSCLEVASKDCRTTPMFRNLSDSIQVASRHCFQLLGGMCVAAAQTCTKLTASFNVTNNDSTTPFPTTTTTTSSDNNNNNNNNSEDNTSERGRKLSEQYNRHCQIRESVDSCGIDTLRRGHCWTNGHFNNTEVAKYLRWAYKTHCPSYDADCHTAIDMCNRQRLHFAGSWDQLGIHGDDSRSKLTTCLDVSRLLQCVMNQMATADCLMTPQDVQLMKRLLSAMAALCMEMNKFPRHYQHCDAVSSCVLDYQKFKVLKSADHFSLPHLIMMLSRPSLLCRYVQVSRECYVKWWRHCKLTPSFVSLMRSHVGKMKGLCDISYKDVRADDDDDDVNSGRDDDNDNGDNDNDGDGVGGVGAVVPTMHCFVFIVMAMLM